MCSRRRYMGKEGCSRELGAKRGCSTVNASRWARKMEWRQILMGPECWFGLDPEIRGGPLRMCFIMHSFKHAQIRWENHHITPRCSHHAILTNILPLLFIVFFEGLVSEKNKSIKLDTIFCFGCATAACGILVPWLVQTCFPCGGSAVS